ncbi:30S ribosomal protein S8 [Candidatus Woesebacteria bacterium RIFCSPHIGHO2_01_FULL_39_17]|uniref:Small ribosomal subunit protein uS8 n=4 Tax=Microgenomates group TaxID=1794810 RepID=A0A0H4TAL1_9BACT|nr:30S ribosomal protein S8, small subunit ribosomal protein S8 [uncultured Microgenomates bacterium Rifle_16ft_4_minimus_954]KKQ51946.1 MAG: ribosomal protein S8, small subunit ribosomal protein S8 [Microgenomates group bacterium GW2011_GWC1_38_12]KKQ94390.1 MAG: 30S ribosomal protein S8 [Candidatus Woesebacteria bacterium GW2011_GWB1_39_10b]KKR14402.1 MAG: 30S ribosomal protein S8 [Candidatus Woesebacteria bacterium GW2011_GWA1_39_21b]OGM23800.1 MAG: 30S ribosomal protein S8 [Candidatus Woese
MINYPIGDFLTQIKNASLAGKKTVEVQTSSFIKATARVLQQENYLEDVREEGKKLTLRISYRKKEPIITDIRLISKPGLRIYMARDEIEKRHSPSILIISTPRGVMSSREAIKKGVGGEVIAEIL